MTETLVCLTARHVASLGFTEGFNALEPTTLDRLLAIDELWFGPRGWLETDEAYRQLVSYVVFRHSRSVLAYRRTPKGGETRLHGKLSVGVGGHVNVTDVVSHEGIVDLRETLRRACAREIAEEVNCATIDRLETVGIIQESANAVSRVHLGVVAECWLSAPEVRPIDPGLVDLRFIPLAELTDLSEQMETWSSALVSYLEASLCR
jgi:predicted NUDIX family phosphoesterase